MMKNNVRFIALRHNAPTTILILFLNVIAATGCSQHSNGFKITHPGKYELIDLGKVDESADAYHAYKVHNKIIYSSPLVTYPSHFSIHLLEHTEVRIGESVLDIGTGTGVQAMFAADTASHVLATDINQHAIKNTLLNARRLAVADKVSARKSDLFNALKPDEKFDVIISAIPFAWNATNQGIWKLQERFFRDVGKHLNPNGRIYFSTGQLDNMPRTKILAEKNNLKIIRIDMDFSRAQDAEPIVYVFKHKPAALWLMKDIEKGSW